MIAGPRITCASLVRATTATRQRGWLRLARPLLFPLRVAREIQERSYRFGRDVMRYAVACEPASAIGRDLLRQLFRSATSVGANLQEAQAAVSRPDFIHKVGVARKESFEARHWLRLRRDMCTDDSAVPPLQREADELCRILSTILINAHRNDRTIQARSARIRNSE